TKQNKLGVLEREIADGLKAYPDWSGGRALRAIVLVRQGKVEEARAALEDLLAKEKDMPSAARMIVGQELDGVRPLSEIELKLYEGAAANDDSGIEYQYGPARRLVTLYHKAGKDAEARELVLKFPRQPSD